MLNSDCIFCKIVNGEVPAYKVFEDERTLAFLDINPLSKGHTLIIPKIHVAQLENLEWKDADALFKIVLKIVKKVQDGVKAPASTIAINNGRESGQEIPHLHVHIIPRFKNDEGGPIHAIMKSRPHLKNDEMEQIAQKIRIVSSI